MGVCSEEPNLCLITEYMQMGSVREILDDRSIDIDWKMTTIMVCVAFVYFCISFDILSSRVSILNLNFCPSNRLRQ